MLFTFPSRYWFAIGYRGVLRLGGWSPHVRTGFHGSRPTRGRRRSLPVRGCHPLWPRFPARSGLNASAAGLVRVRSPLLAESLLMSFPPATEMFQFAGFASTAYGFSGRYPLRDGFPHSEIFGSQIAPISPKLIAGCDVLHRLSVPRHPPNALLSLENNKDNCLTQGQARRRRRLISQRNNHGGPTARSAAPDMRARAVVTTTNAALLAPCDPAPGPSGGSNNMPNQRHIAGMPKPSSHCQRSSNRQTKRL